MRITTRLEKLIAERSRIERAIAAELERLTAAINGSAGLPGCGSDSGYYHHRRQRHEPACPACKLAHAYANAATRVRHRPHPPPDPGGPGHARGVGVAHFGPAGRVAASPRRPRAGETVTLAVAEPAARTGPQIWKDDGLCAGHPDPEAWFPAPSLPDEIAEAECKGCPVTEQCLTFALDEKLIYGTWGGVSEKRRVAMMRGRHPRRAATTRCTRCGEEMVAHSTKFHNPTKYGGMRHRIRNQPQLCDQCFQPRRNAS